MIVEQLIGDALATIFSTLSVFGAGAFGFRLALAAYGQNPQNSISGGCGGAQRKRSLSFTTRSYKLSDPRTIIPLTNTAERAACCQRKSCGLLFHLLLLLHLLPPGCVGRAENETFTSFVYVSAAVRRGEKKTMPPLCQPQVDHGPFPGVLDVIVYFPPPTNIRFLRLLPPSAYRHGWLPIRCYESALLGIAFLLQHRCSK